MTQQGGKLAGGNPSRGRVENDFYATNPISVKAIIETGEIEYPAIEPACGQGHISKLLNGDVDSFDLIDRGFGIGGVDFLTNNFNRNYRTVITNPPFSLFEDFVRKALEISESKVIMFGKLQALEGQKRATYLQSTPLKTVYVFKKRQQPLRNGIANDEITGKKMSSTMAFAWFVWEIGYKGLPQIKWL